MLGAKDFSATHSDPIPCFDPSAISSQHQALVILDCLSLPADTPAQNLAGSIVPSAGSRPCTACRWGASEDVGARNYRREDEGYREAIEVNFNLQYEDWPKSSAEYA